MKDTYNCRTKRRYNHDIKAETVTVYTNDLDCIQFCLDNWDNVKEINTPVDQDHIEYLEDLPYWDHRTSPYYGKYHYKISSFVKHSNRWGAIKNAQTMSDIQQFIDWCKLQFADTGRIRNQNYGNIFSYYYCCPYIYTNDPASIMMLKLNWGDKFKFTVEQVFTGKA